MDLYMHECFCLNPDMFILFLMFMCKWWLTNLSIALCLMKEKIDVTLTTAPAWKFVTFVPVEQLLNWGPPYFNSTHLCSIHSSLSLSVKGLNETATSGQRNVYLNVSSYVWLSLSVFGLKSEVVGCTSSHPLRSTSLLDWVQRFPYNCKASWAGKRFRSNGSQMKGTSRWVLT